MISTNTCSNFRLPFVPVTQQLLLIVQQLLVRLRRILKIASFHNRIDGTGLLAIAAINALCHVDVVARRPPGAVRSFLGFYSYRLRGAGGFAQLAGDASFLPRRVSPQGVFSPKPRAERALFERVVDRPRFLEDVAQRYGETTKQFGKEHGLGCTIRDGAHVHLGKGFAGNLYVEMSTFTIVVFVYRFWRAFTFVVV